MSENTNSDTGLESSEALDQLQPDDTLIDRGVDDVLDEGYIAPDHWSPGMGFGNTPAEMRQGETLEQRVVQETPEATMADDSPWNPEGEEREVGAVRAPRLVVGDQADGAVASSVGLAGGAASAEEAAMHIIEPDDDDVE